MAHWPGAHRLGTHWPGNHWPGLASIGRASTGPALTPGRLRRGDRAGHRHRVGGEHAPQRGPHSNLFTALGPEERFDCVYWNSDFIEAPPDTAVAHHAESARWATKEFTQRCRGGGTRPGPPHPARPRPGSATAVE